MDTIYLLFILLTLLITYSNCYGLYYSNSTSTGKKCSCLNNCDAKVLNTLKQTLGYCDTGCLAYGDCCVDNLFWCYNPVISSIVNPTFPVTGGTVTITGTSFGSFSPIVAYGSSRTQSYFYNQVACLYPLSSNYSTCVLNCNITSLNDNQILCTIPPGSGGVGSYMFTYHICIGGYLGNWCFYMNNTAYQISYTAPSITTLAPLTIATDGTGIVRMIGTNFASTAYAVVSSTIVSSLVVIGNTNANFTVPAGVGASVSVKLVVYSPNIAGLPYSTQESSIFTFSYYGPIISSVSTFSGTPLTSGGAVIMIMGSYFGPTTSSPIVTVGASSCPVVYNNQTVIRCTLPSGSGSSAVTVSAGTQSSASLSFVYSSPSITNIYSSGTIPTSGYIGSSPYVITIVGTSFNSSLATVSMGGNTCTVKSQNHTNIECYVPSGQGTNIGVIVAVGSFSSSTYYVSYGPPTISNVLPTGGSTAGGSTLTVFGTNFGTTSTVSVGGNDCAVVIRNQTIILCTLPSGQGSSIAVVVSLLTQSSSSFSTNVYGAPSFTSISPSNADTNSGTYVLINGANFGTSGTAFIGSYACYPVSNGWRSSSINCTLPQGQGANLAVSVTVSGQSSTNSISFSYNPPTISNVSHTTGATEGNTAITITGSNFGLSASVTIGGATCVYSSQTHSQIICLTSVGSGSLLAIEVNVSSQIVTATTTFSYSNPVPFSLSPSIGNTEGGTTVVILGSSFGTSGTVSIGGIYCTINSYFSTVISIRTPAGQGLNQVVFVLPSTRLYPISNLTFSYNAPSISSISPTAGVSGPNNISLTITGTNFGVSGQSITVGGKNCPLNSTSTQSNTQLYCILQTGTGTSLAVIANVGSQISTGTATFSYYAPVISYLSPTTAGTAGGSTLIITGTSFGSDASLVSVTFGSSYCTNVTASHTQITCIVPSGQGVNLQVRVTVDSQLSGITLWSYSAPSVSSVSPASASTIGGSLLTIRGTNFGSSISSASVSVGGSTCTITFINQTTLFCSIPVGEGINLGIIFSVSTQSALVTQTFSYSAPTISSIIPQDGNTSGGSSLTIYGSNFGLTSTVVIDSSSCVVTSRNHTFLNCTLPQGQGRGLSLIVTASSQTTTTTYSYGVPSLTSIYPLVGPTSGSTLITIYGSNFGIISGSILLGGSSCVPFKWFNSMITCTTPIGQGINQTVYVTASGQVSTQNTVFFNYSAPTLNSVSPLTGGTEGGASITLIGTNFGTSGTILIGEKSCLYTNGLGSYSQVQIICSLPTGSGYNLAISLTVANQVITYSSNFSYSAPSLTSILPTLGDTSGNSILVISGSSFDTGGYVLIGGVNCTIFSWRQNQISVYSPAGSGINKAIVVNTIGNLVSTSTVTFSYNAPSLTPVSPTSASTSGGTSLVLSGRNFNQNVTVSVGNNNCIVTSYSYTSITCNLPAGYGSNLAIIATLDGQSSSPIFFSYSAPSISFITPTTGNTTGDIPITIVGTSFGPNNAGGYVTFGTLSVSLIFWDHALIIFTLPVGQGSSNQVLVIVSSRTSNPATFSYNAPFLTSISPSTGPTGPVASLAIITIYGNSLGSGSPAPSVTIGGVAAPVLNSSHTSIIVTCPAGSGRNLQVYVTTSSQISTNFILFSYDAPSIAFILPSSVVSSGGSNVNIVGTSLGTSGASVTVGGLAATIVSQSDNSIIFSAPAGMGTNLAVAVTLSSQIATISTFNYSAPTITNVSPTNGPTEGGTTIELTGTSFGTSGSITLGGQACAIVSNTYSHTGLRFLSPAGYGTLKSIVLTVSGQSGTTTQTFSYDSPSITSISPTSASTIPNITTLTIIGTSFSTVGSVYFTSTITNEKSFCVPTGSGVSDSRIECLIPGGSGANVVEVVVGALTSTSRSFIYSTPFISSLSPTTAPASGGTLLSIYGSNFGRTKDSNLIITVGGLSCPVASVNDTLIVCSLPPAAGTSYSNQMVFVSVSSQTSTTTFSYSGPALTNITSNTAGCTQVGNALTNCPFSSSVTLTINGANFGDSSTFPVVTVGGKTCSSVTHSVNYTQLQCTIAAGVGTNLTVSVTVAGLTGSANIFSFSGPTLFSNTIRIAGGPYSSSLVNVTSGVDIYFNGTNFIGDGTRVTYGTTSNPDLYNCSIFLLSATYIGCSLYPNVVGANLVFQVTVIATGLGQLISSAGTDTISYPSPYLIGGSLALSADSARVGTSIQGVSSEGESIQFVMKYIGYDLTKINSITYGTSDNPTKYSCTNIAIVSNSFNSSSQVTTLSCQTSSGTGGPYKFQATILNTVTSQGTDTYSYPITPTVYSIKGCTDSGNLTYNCPTLGGTKLTIDGADFSSIDISVIIGSTTCSSLVFVSSAQLTCILPAGAGNDQSVYVIVGKLYSSAQNILSYSSAVLTSVSGCTSGYTDCARAGGTKVTITGTDFGTYGAIILIAGQPCNSVVHDSITPSTIVTCVLNSGTGLNVPVVLIQAGGEISSNQLVLSYAACLAGTIASTDSYICSACPDGTFSASSGLYSCTACSAGTYATSGSSVCLDCPPGTFSRTGASNFTYCSAGTYSAVAPLSDCITCAAGTISNITGATTCLACLSGYYSSTSGLSTCSKCEKGSFSTSASSAGVSQCSPCDAGTYADSFGSTACTTCPAGTVQPSPQMDSCIYSPTGSFVSQSGQIAYTSCASGTFSNVTGLSFCFTCPSGSYSTTGVSVCTKCDAGQYVDINGAANCLFCSLGYFSSSSGLSTCTSCTAGTFSSDRITFANCSAGSYSPVSASSACLDCSQGYYSPTAGSSQCTFCAAGSYASSTALTACSLTPAGTISSKGTTYQACPSGTYSPAVGSFACTTCLAGTYSFSSGSIGPTACTSCSAGQYVSSSGASGCVSCDSGSIQTVLGSTTCSQCSAGTYSVSTQLCSNCAAGKYTSQQGQQTCTDCPRGSYQSLAGQTSCTPCSAGSSQPSTGQLSCIPCIIGTYASSIGLGECISAPVGSISVNVSSTSISNCAPGTYQGSTGKSECTDCPKGSFSNSANSGACIQCPQGKFAATSGTSSCTLCPSGMFAASLGMSFCNNCTAGTYFSSADGGAVTCTSCAEGSFSALPGTTACTSCNLGTYQSNTGYSYCFSCLIGTYAAVTGSKQQCTSCSAGYYQDTTGTTQCITCPAGSSISGSGATSFTPCAVGKYTSTEGAIECSECPTGRYSTYLGTSSCLSCPAGMIQSNTGQSFCLNCTAGTYQSDAGQFACNQCPSGTFNNFAGQTVCASCIAGTFSRNTGQGATACSTCAMGTYTFSSGLDNCLSCPEGQFGNTTSATSCTLCPVGFYSDSIRSTFCFACDTGRYVSTAGALGCLSCAAGTYAGSTASVTCTACEVGKYQNNIQYSTCFTCSSGTISSVTGQVSCQACPAGQVSGISSTSCSNCLAGSYSQQSGLTICTSCDLGTCAPVGGQTACVDCAPGSYNSLTSQTVCSLCEVGKYSPVQSGAERFSCSLCSAGKYAPSIGSYDCLSCPAGTFSNVTGTTFCENCASNTYNPSTGQTACTPCPLGQYVSGSGNVLCFNCPAGTYGLSSGACASCPVGSASSLTGRSTCSTCAAGRETSKEGSLVCNTCNVGYYSISGGLCQICPAGTYAPTAGLTVCTACPSGSYQTLEGQGSCISCASGTYANTTSSTVCILCDAGTYSSLGSVSGSYGPTSCTQCTLGTFNAVFGQDSCPQCGPGLYSNTLGSTVCLNCLAGSFGNSIGLTTCTLCPTGGYSVFNNSRSCLSCSIGTYASTSGLTFCSSCAAGSYQSSTGQSKCIACASGTYVASSGQATCVNCPAGSSNNATGSTFCIQCSVGTYSDIAGSARCTSCDVGTYIDLSGQIRCLSCPLGTYGVDTGSSSCTLCPPGQFQNTSGNTFCYGCSAGYYQSNSGSYVCQECKLGEYSDVTGLSICKDCPSGTYSSDTGLTICTNCGVGTYNPVTKQLSCIQCSSGYFGNSTGLTVCYGCPAGDFGNSTSSSYCLHCSAGYYSILSAQTVCTQCTPGSFSNTTSSPVCTSCFRGTYMSSYHATTCISCPVGSGTEVTGATTCEFCNPGRFSNKVGSVSCTSCPSGQYGISFNQTSCIDCNYTTYSSQPGQVSCDLCPSGTYSSLIGLSQCTSCAIGKYQGSQGQSSCNDCPSGTYAATSGYIVCSPCPIGTYVGGTGLSACASCQAGTFGNTTQAEKCFPCPEGTFSSTDGSISCQPCLAGSYSTQTGLTVCVSCGFGTYQDNIGQSSCKDCSAGTNSNQLGNSACSPCNTGFYSDTTAAQTCTACASGKYQASRGTTACIDCNVGKYSTGNAISCISCDSGYFQPLNGTSTCTACIPGLYQSSVGQTVCLNCPIGYYSNSEHTASCTSCPAGTFGNITGLTVCFSCARGLYQNSIHTSVCLDCPVGKYTSDVRQASCLNCPTGYYNNITAQTVCKPSPPGSFISLTGSSNYTLCELGYFTENEHQSFCTSCPAGKFANYTLGTGQTSCTSCPSSYYSDSVRASTCKVCLAGTEAQSTGMSSCVNCVAGKYGQISEWNSLGNATATNCTFCSAGYRSPSDGSTTCLACPAGYSTNGALGATDCTSCPTGNVAITSGLASCTACNGGKSEPDPTRSFCACKSGYYFDPSYSTAEGCVDCPLGTDCSGTGTTKSDLPLALGYWRKSDTDSVFTQCIIYAACLGGTYKNGRVLERRNNLQIFALIDPISENNFTISDNFTDYSLTRTTCALYSTGPLCANCETGNQKTSSGLCTPCPSYNNSLLYFIGMSILIVVLLVFQMTALLKTSSELLHEDKGYDEDDFIDMSAEDAAALTRLRDQANLSDEELLSQKVMKRLLARIKARQSGKPTTEIIYETDDSILLPRNKQNLDDFTDSRLELRKMTSRFDIDINDNEENAEDEMQLDDEIKRVHRAKGRGAIRYNEDGTNLSSANDFTWKMKIMLGFFQIITNIAIALQVPWPETFLSFVRVISVINFDFISISSTSCIVETSYYFNFIVTIMVPIAILSFLVLFYLIPKYIFTFSHDMHYTVRQNTERELGRCLSTAEEAEYRELEIKSSRKRSRIRFYRMLEFFLFLIYPTISSNVLRLYVCINVDGVSYLMADMSQLCYTETWNQYAIVAGFASVFYAFGIPAFFFYRLFTHRHRLEAPSVRAENGFLFDGYSQEAWYFEMVDLTHKLILTSFLTFLPLDYQLIFGMCVVIFMIIVLMVFRPYRSKGDDRLHLIVQCELFLLLLCGYIYQVQLRGANYSSSVQTRSFDYVMSVILISICLLLFSVFISQGYKFLFKWARSWYESTYPDVGKARRDKEKLIDYQYIDRRNIHDEEDAAKARYLRKQNEKNVFSTDGAKMSMNPLFLTERVASASVVSPNRQPVLPEVPLSNDSDLTGSTFLKNLFFQKQSEPEQIQRN